MTPSRFECELRDLIAYAVFDVDPNVRRAGKPLHFFMVSVALFDAPNGMSSDELHEEVCNQMLFGRVLSAADVDAATRSGVAAGLVLRDGDGTLRLSSVRRAQLDSARTRVGEQRESFFSHMIQAVRDHGATRIDDVVFRDKVELGVQTVLGEQSAVIASAYGPDGAGLDSALTNLNAQNRLREIASALAPGGAGPNKLQRELISAGLESGLRNLPKLGRAYLVSLYHRTVAAALLAQDPRIRRVKHQLASQRIAYLDANVLMAWMFEADPLHAVTVEAIELTRVVGAALRVTTFALDELAAQMREATHFMSRYRGEHRLLSYADDVVVRSFRLAQNAYPGLAWSGFIAAFEPPDAWLEANGVSRDADSTVDLESDNRLGRIESMVRRGRPHAATVTVRTDALNLLHVLRRRIDAPADSMGNRAWLLTNDGSLESCERELAREGELEGPVSRMVRTWSDLLGPCAPPDAEELADYVTRLVQSEFGLLAEDPTFIDKSFLTVLGNSRFKIADVLQDERIAGQVLARLQVDDELTQLLGTAEPESDEWNDQLAAAVQRTLADLQVSTIDQAELDAARAAQAKAEHAAEEERRSRIEAIREAAELRKAYEGATERAKGAEAELAAKARRGFLTRLLGK